MSKKLLISIIILSFLIYGCGPKDTTPVLKQQELLNKAQIAEIDKIKEEQEKKQVTVQ